jgi:uncharacterized membrane protein YbhN (UPF0104 family)
MTGRQNRIALWILKLAFFAGSLAYIVVKIVKSSGNQEFFNYVSQMDGSSAAFLILALLLVPVNWGTEALKWKRLISKLEVISLKKSWKAIWAGLTINNMIPNRVAEVLVRVLFLKRTNRISGIFSSLIGSYCQFFTTAFIGSVGLVWWYRHMPAFHIIILVLSLLGLNFFMLFGLYKMASFSGTMSRIKLMKRLEKYYDVLGTYTHREVYNVLLLSAARYMVYAIQYYLLFRAFGVQISMWHAIMVAALIFLTQAIVPTVTLTEIGIRGAAVLFFAGGLSPNTAGLLLAAYSLWLINVIIPSTIGSFFLIQIRKK